MSSMKDTLDTAQQQITSLAENGYVSAQSGMHDAALRIGKLVAIARNLGFDDVLGAIGLQRRRSPAVTMASFGAGFALGAGLGLLFAPTSGSDLRGKIAKATGLAGVVDKLSQVEKDVEEKVTEKKDELKANVARAAEKAKERMGELKDKAQAEPPVAGTGSQRMS